MKKSTTEKGGAAPSGLAAPTPSVVLFMFSQVGYFLSDFNRRFAPVCVAITRVVFESTVQGVCLSAGAPAPALVYIQAHVLETLSKVNPRKAMMFQMLEIKSFFHSSLMISIVE